MGGDKSSDELLVKAVKNKPLLYDKNHKFYKDMKIKEDSWNDIAQKLGITSERAKKRFKSLRERYVRERKRLNESGSAGQSTEISVFWPLFWSMTFLDDFVEYRGSTPHYNVPKREKRNEKADCDDDADTHESFEEWFDRNDSPIQQQQQQRQGPPPMIQFEPYLTPHVSQKTTFPKKRKTSDIAETPAHGSVTSEAEDANETFGKLLQQIIIKKLNKKTPKEAEAAMSQILNFITSLD